MESVEELRETKDIPGLSHCLLKEMPDSFLHASPRFEIWLLLLDEVLMKIEGGGAEKFWVLSQGR